LLVASIDGIKLTDVFLQEQLEKVLNKTLTGNKPTLDTASGYVRILFNTNNFVLSTAKTSTELNMLNVSYCYSTKEWRCLYRCEIDSSLSTTSPSKIDLTLFGSINNPTGEDWSQVELILVANELEILNNNKPTTAAPTITDRDVGRSTTAISSGGMQVFIKTLTGKTITIDVCLN
jgi:hypothetical protein